MLLPLVIDGAQQTSRPPLSEIPTGLQPWPWPRLQTTGPEAVLQEHAVSVPEAGSCAKRLW